MENNGYFCLASNIQDLIYSIPCSMMVSFKWCINTEVWNIYLAENASDTKYTLGTWLWDDYRTDGHQNDSISWPS